VFILQDITEKRKLETQLRQAQKMETVGTLAGGLAHDLNNILHASRAYLEFGQSDLPPDHPVQDSLSNINRGLNRARGLVKKLLTFSRPKEGNALEEVDLADMAAEAVDLAAPSLPKDLEVRTELNEGCTVKADPGQIQQVAVNLLTNAGQAIRESDRDTTAPAASSPCGDDRLDIRVRKVEVDKQMAGAYINLSPGPHIQLSVSDTGSGMDPDTQKRIFDPFFTTKERGEQKGTGLGLAVVHGIVDALDGEITVHSEPDKGTTFNVYFPGASTSAPADPPSDVLEESSSSPTAGTQRVLVVDDDASVRELETIRLRRLGYPGEIVACGDEALEAVRLEVSSRGARSRDDCSSDPRPYGAVLTDYNMPEMNGLELTRRLRQVGFRGRIVLMTGFRAQVSEAEAAEAGVDMLLQKPVSTERLQNVLQDLRA
jgi:signal transduction histidine kinase/ActR/RegA family two-component response regulator